MSDDTTDWDLIAAFLVTYTILFLFGLLVGLLIAEVLG